MRSFLTTLRIFWKIVILKSIKGSDDNFNSYSYALSG